LNNRHCRFRKRCNPSRRLKKDSNETKYPLATEFIVVTNSGLPITIIDKETLYTLTLLDEIKGYLGKMIKVYVEPKTDLSYLSDIKFNCGGMKFTDPSI